METLEIRQQINEYLEQLSPDKLLVAADFLAYLSQKESDDPTLELLKIDGIEEAYQNAKKNIIQGKVISVDQLKRKY